MTEASSSPEKTGPPARKRKSGVIVPHQAKWHQRADAFLVFVLLRALMVRCAAVWLAARNFWLPTPPVP